MFMVLSSWQSHCESLPGSRDECRIFSTSLLYVGQLTKTSNEITYFISPLYTVAFQFSG